MDGSKKNKFWHPPLWKWALVLGLLGCSELLFLWKRPGTPVKVELLPFTDSPPAWDGSQPWLVISPVAGVGPIRFKTSIDMVKPTLRHDAPVNEFVVNLRNGNFKLRQTDLFVPDVMPLSLTRTYFAWNPYSRASSEFYGAMTAWNGNGWTTTFRDGRKIYFPEAYFAKNFAQGAATEMVDAEGHRIQLKRSKVRNLEQLISPSGHTITFKYDASDRIVEARDDAGHIRSYTYGEDGHVHTVSDGSHVLYQFEYQRLVAGGDSDPWLLTAVLDGDWIVLVRNKFSNGRVTEQALADGEVYRYEYRLKGRDVLQTTITLPSGEQKVFTFRDGRLVEQK